MYCIQKLSCVTYSNVRNDADFLAYISSLWICSHVTCSVLYFYLCGWSVKDFKLCGVSSDSWVFRQQNVEPSHCIKVYEKALVIVYSYIPYYDVISIHFLLSLTVLDTNNCVVSSTTTTTTNNTNSNNNTTSTTCSTKNTGTSEAHIPPLLGVAPLGPAQLTVEHELQFKMLQAAFFHMPHPSDSERLRLHLPRQPCQTPLYYPQVKLCWYHQWVLVLVWLYTNYTIGLLCWSWELI